VGSIVGAGLTLVAMLLAAVLSLTIISIAWIFYRPLLGITLLALGAGAIYGIWYYIAKIRGKPKPAAESA
jgi:hypothetical protein